LICTILQIFTPIGATVAEISVTGQRKKHRNQHTLPTNVWRVIKDCARGIPLWKLTTDGHNASRGLSPTVELLLFFEKFSVDICTRTLSITIDTFTLILLCDFFETLGQCCCDVPALSYCQADDNADEVKGKGKGKGLDTCYSATYMSQTRDQQRFTISEVAADWHEPMVPQRIMWPSIACPR